MTIKKLTKRQKEVLDQLRQNEGYCHVVFDGQLLRVFRNLESKGYVEIKSAYGQLQRGEHIYIKE